MLHHIITCHNIRSHQRQLHRSINEKPLSLNRIACYHLKNEAVRKESRKNVYIVTHLMAHFMTYFVTHFMIHFMMHFMIYFMTHFMTHFTTHFMTRFVTVSLLLYTRCYSKTKRNVALYIKWDSFIIFYNVKSRF